jgi:hypothetical protein
MSPTAVQDSELVREVTPGLGALEQQTRGEIDIQVSTAKRYPRSVTSFKQRAEALALLDEETAEACFYVVPRDGKNVEGPSARLAEIIASTWGHMRVEARVVDEDDKYVTSRGTAWDLESNVAIAFEVRRRITKKNGQRYNDDMIVTASNAGSSIALRNAVFKVVPSALWRPIYEKCRLTAAGDAQTLADRRAKMLLHFQKLHVQHDRIFALLGVQGVEDITLEHMITLKGLASAIKEGDTSVDSAFPPPAAKEPQRKTNDAPNAQAPQASAPAAAAPHAAAPPASEGQTKAASTQPSAPRAQPAAVKTSAIVGFVDDTRYVTKNNEKFYEITIRNRGGAQTFMAADALGQLAASFEGTEQQVEGEWRDGQALGRVVKELISVQIYEGQPAPAELKADDINFGGK